MARWMWIILIIAIPFASAHAGSGDHQGVSLDFEETGEVFMTQAKIEKENATIQSIRLSNGESLMKGGSASSLYALRLLSDEKEILLEMPINTLFTFHSESMKDGEMTGTIVEREYIDMFFRIPALKNSTMLEFIKGEEVLTSKDLREFCSSNLRCGGWRDEITCPSECSKKPITKCGNSVCDADEMTSCPQDCPQIPDTCGEIDSRCDSTCPDDPDCKAPIKETEDTPILPLVGLAALAIILVVAVIIMNKKTAQRPR